MSGSERWWEFTALFWFASVFLFYIFFGVSLALFESRVFFSTASAEKDTFMERFLSCANLRKKHSLSGYSRTTYASFGSPEAALSHSSVRLHVVIGTLQENKRSFYSRFTQLPFLQGRLYETLEDFPHRLFTVDDITGQRPYMTSYSWGLERHFCKPRKTRCIDILREPGAMTTSQFKSTIACSLIGVFLVYFLIASMLMHFNMPVIGIIGVLVLFMIYSLPFLLSPCKLNSELTKIRQLKQEWKRRDSVIAAPTGGIPGGIPANELEKDNTCDESKVNRGDDVEAVLKPGSLLVGDTPSAGDDGGPPTKTNSAEIEPLPSTASSVLSGAKKKVSELTDTINEKYLLTSASEVENPLEWNGFSAQKNNVSMGVITLPKNTESHNLQNASPLPG